MGVPTGFTNYNGIWCLSGSRIYQRVGGTMIEDNTTSFRTDWSSENDDMISYRQTVIATNTIQGKVYWILAGAWAAGPTITNGSYNNLFVYMKGTDMLYLMSGVTIRGISQTGTYPSYVLNMATTGTPNCLELDASPYNIGGDIDGGFPHCMAAGSDKIWIGTMRSNNGSGSWDNANPGTYSSVYEWDGISSKPTKEYKIPAQGVASIVMWRDIPVIMDTEGVLRKYDGQGFVEIGRLPVRRNQQLRFIWSYTGGNRTQNFIHPKGLCISKDDTILAFINGNSVYDSNNIIENLPSGIWEFDGKGSVVHRNSLSLLPQTSTSLTDYGQNKLALIGSLANIKTSNFGVGESQLWCGAQFYTTASATDYGVFSDAPSPTNNGTYPEGQKYGYFVTPFYQSNMVNGRQPGASELWKKIWLNYRQLLDSGDKIIVKYRTVEATPLYPTITWVNTTSFTTTTNLTAYVGYEVEIVQGVGGGKCSHITSVVNNSGTFTVTVDETYTGATTTTAIIRVQNWTKIGSINDQNSEMKQLPIGKNTSRLQVKVCMQFTGDDEVHQLAIISSPFIPLE
jgi:hypothetical protein